MPSLSLSSSLTSTILRAHTHTCTYTYISVHARVHTHMWVRAHGHTHIPICKHRCTHTYTSLHACAYKHMHTHMWAHTDPCTWEHIHSRTSTIKPFPIPSSGHVIKLYRPGLGDTWGFFVCLLFSPPDLRFCCFFLFCCLSCWLDRCPHSVSCPLPAPQPPFSIARTVSSAVSTFH